MFHNRISCKRRALTMPTILLSCINMAHRYVTTFQNHLTLGLQTNLDACGGSISIKLSDARHIHKRARCRLMHTKKKSICIRTLVGRADDTMCRCRGHVRVMCISSYGYMDTSRFHAAMFVWLFGWVVSRKMSHRKTVIDITFNFGANANIIYSSVWTCRARQLDTWKHHRHDCEFDGIKLLYR